ncbi:MAG: hypothetical protein H6719_33815 [Sandaracinaceae bacterium]|nr:hypothetical protein [Sandaracinaceae bacterium]
MTRRTRALAGVLAVAWGLGAGSAAAQDPDERGSLTVEEWDAGRVTLAGASIPVRVLYPSDGVAPYPLVGVIHGASRTGANHRVLAETFASRGFVVLLPDMPCGFTGCDHDANANQLVALLEWGVARSGDGASPIAGLVDASRRALVGHSWGALASHLAAARDSSIDALVLLDPNDDGTVGRDATPTITAPTAQLLAAVPGTCNSQWNEGVVTPMLPTPALQLTVTRSAHCDPEEPGDFLCPIGCGAGDASTSVVFRRYSIAWVSCVLRGDAEMGAWLGGGSMSGDETASRIGGVVARGLDELPCRGGTTSDAGPADLDAGAGSDAGASDPDAGSTDAGAAANDAGARDAGAAAADAGARADAGDGTGTAGGCACEASQPGTGPEPLALRRDARARVPAAGAECSPSRTP